MVKNSTLFYLVDDLNMSSDILLSTSNYSSCFDEEVNSLLDLLDYDPGARLVTETLERANVE